jgi:hypothetical protein
MPRRKNTISTKGGALPGGAYMKLTSSELTVFKSFLRQAHALVAQVSAAFFNTGDGVTAARLNDITGRICDEIQHIDRLMTALKDGKP